MRTKISSARASRPKLGGKAPACADAVPVRRTGDARQWLIAVHRQAGNAAVVRLAVQRTRLDLPAGGPATGPRPCLPTLMPGREGDARA
jgi:hypothetical protein